MKVYLCQQRFHVSLHFLACSSLCRGGRQVRELSDPGVPAPVGSAPCLVFLKSHVIDHVRPALQGPPLPFGVQDQSHWASCLSLRFLLRPIPPAQCGHSWLFSVLALCLSALTPAPQKAALRPACLGGAVRLGSHHPGRPQVPQPRVASGCCSSVPSVWGAPP